MSAARHEISDLAYTAAVAGCIESPRVLAINQKVHGDNFMMGFYCLLRNGMNTPSSTLHVVDCELLVDRSSGEHRC